MSVYLFCVTIVNVKEKVLERKLMDCLLLALSVCTIYPVISEYSQVQQQIEKARTKINEISEASIAINTGEYMVSPWEAL